ncbi:polysaccharide deacetylase family protein [Phenylobacterium aquaticum]|uniref:oligosaccharide deacetylase HfsH n=1 Tax=Phenylobacterium aquaticum TaxID=1763816 RepID=UPI0026F03845|nr:polysaccharide deacetylase family protein [Phenylobacterium aquaticum]
MTGYEGAYSADRSLAGKLRRRLVRLAHKRPLAVAPQAPMVSFTFDDAPLSSTIAGAALLETRGLAGTYYVSAGLAGQAAPMGPCAEPIDYQRLARAGHEIACHTYSHLDCGRAKPAAAWDDTAHNARALADWGLFEVENFAYPYGEVAGGPKQALARRYATLRALHHGVITQGTDLNQLPAVGIEGADGEAVARRWLAEAKARKAWLILYTHDVRPDPSPWGCAPDVLARLIDQATHDGFQVVTVREAMRRLLAPVSAAA